MTQDDLKIEIQKAKEDLTNATEEFDKQLALYRIQNYEERLNRLAEFDRFSERENDEEITQ